MATNEYLSSDLALEHAPVASDLAFDCGGIELSCGPVGVGEEVA